MVDDLAAEIRAIEAAADSVVCVIYAMVDNETPFNVARAGGLKFLRDDKESKPDFRDRAVEEALNAGERLIVFGLPENYGQSVQSHDEVFVEEAAT
jgi:hypothetical protein